MEVTIHGPNLNDQSKGTFHIHAASCGDNNHYGPGRRFGGDGGDWTIDADSRVGVGDDIYSDHIAEGSMASGEGVEDCWFAPCCAELPQATPEEIASAEVRERLAEEVNAMRAWLADCEWRNMDAEEIGYLPAEEIRQAVESLYDGGFAQFRRDSETGPQALKRVVSEAVADGAEVAVNIAPPPPVVAQIGPRIAEHMDPIEESLAATVKLWSDALSGVAPEGEEEDYPEGYSLLDHLEGILDLSVSRHGVYLLYGTGGPHVEVQIVVSNGCAMEIVKRRAWWSPTERGVCVDIDALNIAEAVWQYLREAGVGEED